MVVLERSFARYKIHPRLYELDNKTTPSSASVQFSIHSNSKYKSILVRSRTDGEVLLEMEEPITVRVAEALESPLTHDTSYPIIHDMLSTLALDSAQLAWLINALISKAAEIVDGSPVGRNTLWVMNVEIEIIRVFIEELIDDDADEGRRRGGMVPATASSIAADLEQVMVNNITGDCCVICLEEFPMGSYFTRMPCSHVFHSDCIIKWLNTSHYCPLCRFEMPT